jgi:hypothetical protein
MKLKKSMKLRVNSNGISFYTTVKQIQEGVGSSSVFNDAILNALTALKELIEDVHFVNGIGGTWIGYQIQLDIVQ